jgi:carbon starvation protein
MLVVTIVSLLQTIIAKINAVSQPQDVWAIIQATIAVLLVVLSLVLAKTAFTTLMAQRKNKAKKDNAA